MQKIFNKIILMFLTLVLLTSMLNDSFISAQENMVEYKEVNTVDEFLNSKDPVSIDTDKLSRSELNKLLNANKNGNELVNYSKSNTLNGYKNLYQTCKGGKRNFTKKITNNDFFAVAGVTAPAAGIGKIKYVAKHFAAKFISGWIGGGVSIASGATGGALHLSGQKGIIIKGYTSKKVVRKSPYELPSCGRIATVTSIKPYK